MNKNKFLVLSKWTNEKDTGMFGVWTYWKSWVQQGFSFLEKKKRFVIGPLVSHIFYLKVNWVIPLLRTALRFKKNDKTHVCRIMFKIYNFKTLSGFNLLLNKKGGGDMNTNFCGKTYLSPITPEITCTSVNKIQNVFISRIWSSR